MKIDAEQVLCRFQLSNFARHGLGSLYEWIVHKARREGLQGATVREGFYGMGPNGEILSLHAWPIAQERPVIVEVVDEPARIEALLAHVEPLFHEGVITLERAHVFLYRAGPRDTHHPIQITRNILSTVSVSAANGVRTMKTPENGVLLRIFIGHNDREPEHGRPLYEAIVQRAQDAQLAGATVLRGAVGYGRHSRIHTAKLLELSTDLPIVIEIVDAEDKVEAFLPTVDALVTEGLVTLEAVRIIRYAAADAL
jgi:uncharacterized protein